jgi:hypothetical protein
MVRFIDHQDICNLENACFDRLDVIPHARGFHNDGGMRQAGDIHFGLTRTHGFDQDEVKTGCIQYLHHAGSRFCHPAKCPP